jgi:hypothetical protein
MCFSAAEVLIEEVLENPTAVPPNVRCLAASQMIDKGQLLQGLATARVEHAIQPVQVSNYEEYEQLIAPLQKKAQARIIEAEKIAGRVVENDGGAPSPGAAQLLPGDSAQEVQVGEDRHP